MGEGIITSELLERVMNMIVNRTARAAILLVTCFLAPALRAQVAEGITDYSKATPADFADEDMMKEVMSGGVPMGRWKEGLLFDGIAPQPWLKSAANWMPGT